MMDAQEDALVEAEIEDDSADIEDSKKAYYLAILQTVGWNLVVAISLGQLLSMLNCGTAVTSGLLQQQGVTIPTAQSFLNYVLLCLVYTSMLACRKGEANIWPVLKERGWKYFLLGLVDVEANYLIVKAYHYTTVTSVQLLDCFTIPTVLVLSWLLLRVRYKVLHVVGVGLSLMGVGALIAADMLVDKAQGEGSNKILGDMLCLAGATLYGISNVGQEFVVRNFNSYEFLGMIGLFGSVINGIQLAVLERDEILKVNWQSYQTMLPLVGFAVCLFAMYSLMPYIMRMTSAAAVNLNLLTADFYSLLFGLFLFHYKFHYLYFISFGLIILGVVVYSIRPPPVMAPHGGAYREMPTDLNDNGTPSMPPQTEVTYHSARTSNGSAEACNVHVLNQYHSTRIPEEEEQKHLVICQDEASTATEEVVIRC